MTGSTYMPMASLLRTAEKMSEKRRMLGIKAGEVGQGRVVVAWVIPPLPP